MIPQGSIQQRLMLPGSCSDSQQSQLPTMRWDRIFDIHYAGLPANAQAELMQGLQNKMPNSSTSNAGANAASTASPTGSAADAGADVTVTTAPAAQAVESQQASLGPISQQSQQQQQLVRGGQQRARLAVSAANNAPHPVAGNSSTSSLQPCTRIPLQLPAGWQQQQPYQTCFGPSDAAGALLASPTTSSAAAWSAASAVATSAEAPHISPHHGGLHNSGICGTADAARFLQHAPLGHNPAGEPAVGWELNTGAGVPPAPVLATYTSASSSAVTAAAATLLGQQPSVAVPNPQHMGLGTTLTNLLQSTGPAALGPEQVYLMLHGDAALRAQVRQNLLAAAELAGSRNR